MDIKMKIYNDELIELRRELHKIPEIAYNEYKTCEFITKKLKEYNIDYEIVFKTGVVCIIGDVNKECIAFRMDMDGLFIKENNDVCYKSEIPGMMHACGHDGHVAILLMTAKILKQNEKELKKCVKLIFQPAEEGSGGAEHMIKEGVLSNPIVSAVYGCHLWPEVIVGKAEYVEKTAFAGSYRYLIRVIGKGGHGAMPEKVINSLLPASEIILELSKLHEREKESVVSACCVNTTGTFNTFTSDTEILGTIRTLSNEARDRILAGITKIIDSVKEKYNIEIEFIPTPEYPPCVNDDQTLENLVDKAKKAIGEENVTLGKVTYGAEDFAYYGLNCKTAHIRVGTKNPDDEATHYPLHNPNFNIDENSLAIAVKIFLELAFS